MSKITYDLLTLPSHLPIQTWSWAIPSFCFLHSHIWVAEQWWRNHRAMWIWASQQTHGAFTASGPLMLHWTVSQHGCLLPSSSVLPAAPHSNRWPCLILNWEHRTHHWGAPCLLPPTPNLHAISSYHCLRLFCHRSVFLLNEGQSLYLCSGSHSDNNS